MPGSSPHTRGTPRLKSHNARAMRFIPAYAGNAIACFLKESAFSVHPRIRGERPVRPATERTPYGSSPHTRGTPPSTDSAPRYTRFIPAYAGNAAVIPLLEIDFAVHPRIRGERRPAEPGHGPEVGSSPHTRGTHRVEVRLVDVRRFIPAYAGNAGSRRRPAPVTPVHPRIRGERSDWASRMPWPSGSSPHTRGTPEAAGAGDSDERFIPAYAGNASGMQSIQCRPAVHPRIRGERSMKAEVPQNTLGSSPHTRGTRDRPTIPQTRSRFIPAYAGNAMWRRSDTVGARGSSPHTRGTLR